MPYYCTVPRCTSMAGKAKNVSFHQFPRDLELARLWNDILKRGKPYTKYSKVCSLHFRPEDYTITSVGKNKGQWRTLRKDAVPSQNLPSETPAPYSRKQWDSWSQNCGTPNVIDPTIQQQMAQAIYMQTMLAMQAAGHSDGAPVHNGPTLPELPSPHTSNHDKLKNSDITSYKLQKSDTNSYKCNECTKCFKDPDVFILHKRSHSKTVEKENFNMNLTLQSNPILANLLKSNSESFEPIMAMENLLMTALAANIDYIRNYSMTKDNDEAMNHDRSENFTRNHGNSDGNHENHNDDYGNHGNNHGNERYDGSPNSSISDEVNERNEIQVRNDLVNSRMESPTTDRASIHGRQNFRNNEINHHINMNDSTSDMISSRADMNSPRSDVNNSRIDMNNRRSNINQLNQIKEEVELLNQDRINTHSVNVNLTGHVGLSVRHINYEKDFSENIATKRLSFSGNNYTEDETDFRVRSSDDLNESMDSNNLVIDESVEF